MLIGVALIAASLRLVPAGLHRHAARAAAERVTDDKRSTEADLDALARHSRRALALAGHPGDTRRLALVAGAHGQPARVRALLMDAVRRAPDDAIAWTRLAALHHRHGRPENSADALVQALRAAPSMRHLAPVRAELILRHWPAVSARAPVAVLERQIRLGADAAPDPIARVADATGRSWLLSAARAGLLRRR